MICQQCGKDPATVSFTKIVNGEKIEIYICDQCAKKQEINIQGIPNGVLNEHLLSGLLDGEGNNELPVVEKESPRDIQCPKCGLSYSEFVKTGRVGCVECYIQFADRLTSMLERNHGTVAHHGKIPKRKKSLIQDKQQLTMLKNELQSLIEREKYEQAADIRDQIRELEKKLSSQ